MYAAQRDLRLLSDRVRSRDSKMLRVTLINERGLRYADMGDAPGEQDSEIAGSTAFKMLPAKDIYRLGDNADIEGDEKRHTQARITAETSRRHLRPRG
jgi:hypothetical protein